MKKGQVYQGIVEKVKFPNKGIVTIEGEEEKVVVKGTLPQQKVEFVINKKRKGKCEGRLLQVVEQSPSETREAPCCHFGACGGCSYQTLPYEEQLNLKANQVKELLDEVHAYIGAGGIEGKTLENPGGHRSIEGFTGHQG